MENVLSLFDYVNGELHSAMTSGMPAWAKSKRLFKVERYARAFNQNETWLNSIEALFHRYNINVLENNEMEKQ